MTGWHRLFLIEVAFVRQLYELSKLDGWPRPHTPHHASRALMLKGLLQRIHFTWAHFTAARRHVPAVPLAMEARNAFNGLQQSLQQNINAVNMQVGRPGHLTSPRDEGFAKSSLFANAVVILYYGCNQLAQPLGRQPVEAGQRRVRHAACEHGPGALPGSGGGVRV